MDLVPSPEQTEVVASVAAFLAKELPMSRIRESFGEPSSVDATVWAKAAALGWFVLGLPEDLGGVGYGMAEEALLFREIGRHLATGPLAATVLGARLAARSGQLDLSAAIGAGETIVGLGMPRHGGGLRPDGQLSGELDLIDAVGAQLVLVADPAGAALLDAGALSEVSVTESIDEGTRLGTSRADEVTPTAFVSSAIDDIFNRGAVLAAAMLTGVAEAARDDAVEYAKVRVQYGQAIGSYQAIKHPCANMALRAEAAASQLFFAALAVDGARPDVTFQVSSAKVVAADAARSNAAANVQIHGGMGFTFEQDVHLYVKRAHILHHMFGSTPFHLSRVLAAEAPV